jgi:hypothetical protein
MEQTGLALYRSGTMAICGNCGLYLDPGTPCPHVKSVPEFLSKESIDAVADGGVIDLSKEYTNLASVLHRIARESGVMVPEDVARVNLTFLALRRAMAVEDRIK